MYLIANTSSNDITLSDLGVTLFSNQAIDLDKIKTDISPRKSANLKEAVNKRKVKILVVKNENDNNIVEDDKRDIDKDEIIRDLKSFLKDEISVLKNNQTPIQQESQDSKKMQEQMSQLLNLVQQMTNNNLNQGNQFGQGNQGAIKELKSEDLTDEQLAKMHAKVVKKMAEKIQGTIEYHKKEIQDDSISNKANELENLL